SPATNRYRYKLDGLDAEWTEAGSDRRRAVYTTLPARSYTFRVQAATPRGPWGIPGTSLRIDILPPWWQTWWFSVVCGILVLVVLVSLYQWRLRRVAWQFNVRLDARVNERTRIARELHDTLLQSFLGVRFRFQAARNLLPNRPAEAIDGLDRALDQAGQAIKDGREAIQGLRSSTLVQSELADAIGVLGAERSDVDPIGATTLNIDVEGRARDLPPLVRDDVYRIAAEAIRNAFKHAQARRIDVNIGYNPAAFRVLVKDDGTGIDAKRFEEPDDGHWGLPGMRERAELLGGTLRLMSKPGAGTQVEVTVPARRAYAHSSHSRRFGWRRTRRTGP